MLHISRISARVFACMLTGFAVVSLSPAQTIQIDKSNKTIAINTSDEATATADIAAVTVGFEIYGPDYASTYASGAIVSHAVLDALQKAGVEDKSIESTGQGLERNSDFDDKENAEQRTKKQFVFSQSWEVSVPPQSAAEVIRAAVAAGANKSGAIDWRLADRKALQAKAAEAALVKARGSQPDGWGTACQAWGSDLREQRDAEYENLFRASRSDLEHRKQFRRTAKSQSAANPGDSPGHNSRRSDCLRGVQHRVRVVRAF
jgi:uncharacterized protein YggE